MRQGDSCTKIAFFQYRADLAFHDSMQLMIWTIGDPDATAHLGSTVGALPLQLIITSPTTSVTAIDRFPRMIWKEIEQ